MQIALVVVIFVNECIFCACSTATEFTFALNIGKKFGKSTENVPQII